MVNLGDVKTLAVVGLLGVGLYLTFKLQQKAVAPEPKGVVSPTAYRGTDLQTGLPRAIQSLVGFGPGWLGIPPSGAAGMRYYGQVYK